LTHFIVDPEGLFDTLLKAYKLTGGLLNLIQGSFFVVFECFDVNLYLLFAFTSCLIPVFARIYGTYLKLQSNALSEHLFVLLLFYHLVGGLFQDLPLHSTTSLTHKTQ